jgi:hypothetical protein
MKRCLSKSLSQSKLNLINVFFVKTIPCVHMTSSVDCSSRFYQVSISYKKNHQKLGKTKSGNKLISMKKKEDICMRHFLTVFKFKMISSLVFIMNQFVVTAD